MNSKYQIRKEIRLKRQCLCADEKSLAGLAVLKQLRRVHRYHGSERVAIYMDNDGELPLAVVAEDIWKRKKKCLLPVITGNKCLNMRFAGYDRKTVLVENQFNIPEPDVSVKRQVKSSLLDLVLLPLVAFDDSGNRIGMGGGYYDRSFSYLKNRTHWRKPYLLGVAYDFQQVQDLQNDCWDIPLDAIITPSRLIQF